MYKILWNISLWLKGITIIIMAPFVLMWVALIDGPIAIAKKFLSERND
jgi:hypothetical protein